MNEPGRVHLSDAEVHKKIREDPVHEKKEKSAAKPKRDGNEVRSSIRQIVPRMRLGGS